MKKKEKKWTEIAKLSNSRKQLWICMYLSSMYLALYFYHVFIARIQNYDSTKECHFIVHVLIPLLINLYKHSVQFFSFFSLI